MTTASPYHDRATPADLRAVWVAAIAAGDADALRPLLSDDYEVWAHATPALSGADAAIEAMRGALQRFRIEQSFDAIETVVAGDWAFERGIERVTVTPITGGASQTMTQRALLILRRDPDGAWQFARGMTNGFPPSMIP